VQTRFVANRRTFVITALAAAAIAFITAIAASWPWDSRPGDPRWEMIRQRAHEAKESVERKRRRGETISPRLLAAEIEMESELATQDDLQAAGRALHSLEEAIRSEPVP
jgi:hypothetical protein